VEVAQSWLRSKEVVGDVAEMAPESVALLETVEQVAQSVKTGQ